MSWNIQDIKSRSVSDAKRILAASKIPSGIEQYALAGVDGLVTRYGKDILVTISGHGHLCNDSYDVTSATINVARG
jgi:hypothetical protein